MFRTFAVLHWKRNVSEEPFQYILETTSCSCSPPVPSSNKSILKDFNNFARTMSVRYMFAEKRKTLAHPFHVKSTWQPPIQNSVALERTWNKQCLNLLQQFSTLL